MSIEHVIEVEVGTYEVVVNCSNCGWGSGRYGGQRLAIPRGREVERHLELQECPGCGCRTIQRKELW